MKKTVVRKLNQLNLDFYAAIAEHFDATRQHHWPGWWQVAEELEKTFFENQKQLRVLDIGCGNGRFGTFIENHFSELKLDFYGVDSDEILLEKAKIRLAKVAHLTLEKVDIVESILTNQPLIRKEQTFDLVSLFGVQHHIPGFENRVELLKKAALYLTSNDLLVFSCWQFTNLPRFDNRVITPEKIGIDGSDLQNNDFLLDWRGATEAIRYCHLTTLEEAREMCKQAHLEVITHFEADAKFNNGNLYIVAKLAD